MTCSRKMKEAEVNNLNKEIEDMNRLSPKEKQVADRSRRSTTMSLGAPGRGKNTQHQVLEARRGLYFWLVLIMCQRAVQSSTVFWRLYRFGQFRRR